MKQLSKKTDIIFYSLIIISVLITYWTSLKYPFLEGWDDQAYITQNPYIALNFKNILFWFTHAPPVGGYTPLTMLTFMLDHSIWGFNSIGYHLQNIFWHIVTVLLVYRIFKYLKIEGIISILLCLIFALHPQRIESVVWISERKDVLCGAFYFLAILIYLKNYRKEGVSIWVYICFILALLSKPMAYSLPFIFILHDFHMTKSFRFNFYIRKYWKFLIVLIPYGIITVIPQSYGIVSGQITFIKRVYIILYNFLWYAYSTFVPINLSPIYARVSLNDSYIWVFAGYFIVVIVLMYMLFKHRKTAVFTVFPSVLTYIVSLIPVCGIFLLGLFDHADRFSYIPSVFIWLGAGGILTYLMDRSCTSDKYKQVIRFLIYCVLALYLGFVVYLNTNYIKTFKSLYNLNRAVAAMEMPNPIVLQKLGIMEVYRGDYKEAFKIADRLVNISRSDSLTLNERDSSLLAAASLRFLCYYFTGKKEKAIKLFEEIKPFYSTTGITEKQNYLAILSLASKCYYSLGMISKAIDSCNEIIDRCRGNKYIYYYYTGQKALFMGNKAEAAECFKTAAKLKPARLNALEYIENYKQ